MADEPIEPALLALRRAQQNALHGVASGLSVITINLGVLAPHLADAEGEKLLAEMQEADARARTHLEALRRLL